MRNLSAALLCMIVSAAPAFCKDKDKSKDSADKKRSLVTQIIDTVEANKPDEKEREEFKKKRQERMDHLIDAVAEKSGMGEEAKNKLKEKLSASKERERKPMPPEIKAKFEKTFGDSKTFCKDMTVQVMSEHFDDSDLKSILKFLKSKTGKKLIKEAPDMLAQTIAISLEHYLPPIVEACKDLKNCAPMLTPLGPNGGGDSEKRKEMIEKFKQMYEQLQKQKAPISGPNKDET